MTEPINRPPEIGTRPLRAGLTVMGGLATSAGHALRAFGEEMDPEIMFSAGGPEMLFRSVGKGYAAFFSRMSGVARDMADEGRSKDPESLHGSRHRRTHRMERGATPDR